MAKRLVKGKKGTASQYITRKRAMKKLQLSLRDFRRLCILKGIYPREPRKKLSHFKRIYYHVKDIRFLAHERLLSKFREIAAFTRKIKRATNRKDHSEAARLQQKIPTYSLVHLVKERYPNFLDALRDLDDPLSLISLYAHFASHKTLKINLKVVWECRRLQKEFALYIVATRALRKVFFSIKGIYLQAEIHGQAVTWLVPYKFSQDLPYDVDYDVMGSFLEFYMALLKSTNLRLFKEIGQSYPVISKPASRDNPESLGRSAEDIVALQKRVEQLMRQGLEEQEEEGGEEEKSLRQQYEERWKERRLFQGLKFFISREVPREMMEMLIRAFGGEVGHEADDSPYGIDDEKITHQIVDRPVPGQQVKEAQREFIQPQWVADCINYKMLLPVYQYAPGVTLPAHLSPFVDNQAEGYIPTREKEISAMKGIPLGDAQEAEEAEQDEDYSESEAQSEEEEDEDESEEGEEEEDEDEEEEDIDSEEEEMLLRASRVEKKRAQVVEKKELGKLLMSNRQKKLYRNAQEVKREKKRQAEVLERKRGGGS